MSASTYLELPRSTNQVRGLAQYAIDFLAGKFAPPSDEVLQLVEKFFMDSMVCGVSAIAEGTNAPNVLRDEALESTVANEKNGVPFFGSKVRVSPEKAILANSAAVREWDSNGTNFGYNPSRGDTAGEFGHNDYYPVAVAAAQMQKWDGAKMLRAMLLIDEIRGRLAEVFSLKSYKIDHVVHGAIASAIVYAASLDCTVDQIESAVGMFVAHYIPFRAIRHGHQLSDSKGASAAFSSEVAVRCAMRAKRGFIGPADVFRNPEAIFCLFTKQKDGKKHDGSSSPFDLRLTASGDDFSIRGMHFKLGLYEHQSAGALQGLLDLLAKENRLLESANAIEKITVTIYEPAYNIICDPHKWHVETRQSADHSLPYIISTLLRKAIEQKTADWKSVMLLPEDYNDASLKNETTQRLMKLVELKHGGPEYDRNYPDGIPTEVELTHKTLGKFNSGMVMYPTGHARNTTAPLAELLKYKFEKLAALGVKDVPRFLSQISNLTSRSAADVQSLYDFELLK